MTEARESKPRRSLATVVDAEVYQVWTEMLGRIGRDSRTKRLSVLVAGMLQFAAFKAFDKWGHEAEPGTIAGSLFNAHDWEDPDEIVASLRDIVEQLFMDAGLPYVRTNGWGGGLGDEACVWGVRGVKEEEWLWERKAPEIN